MTPPRWLQDTAAHWPRLYGRLFRFCFRCGCVRWRTHEHAPLSAAHVLNMTDALRTEQQRRRDATDGI